MDRVTPEFIYMMGIASLIAGVVMCALAVVWRYAK